MHASDYYNSWTYVKNTNSWLFITNGLTGNPSQVEWTLTRYGYIGSNYGTWYVNADGTLGVGWLKNTAAVRPVFYLIPNITLTGEGSESNPFIIHSS